MMRLALRRFSSDDYSDAFAFIPEIEVVFFESPPLPARLAIDPSSIERGRYRPKAALLEILEGRGLTLEDF